jgi:AAA15 family ATPase/GTPase
LGPNGHGKSTILHALACCYQPLLNNPVSKDYKHNQFFPPTSDSTWTDSNFTLYHSYRDGEETINTHLHYSKKRQWKPGYGSRPSRYVYFIGIETCVPDIEKEKQKTIIKYDKTNLSEEIYSQIKNKASYIMNREYVEYHNLVTNKNKKYKGVKYSEYSYSSLNMGAGEQRIFLILEKVYKAPKYALILIDEIDLLLHDDALYRLLKTLEEIANTKKNTNNFYNAFYINNRNV